MTKTCWASSLGDCDRMSKEHIVSKALFLGDTVEVHGFPWCKDAPKTIGMRNLTTTILCRRHNSLLSPVDQAAVRAFQALREMTRVSMLRLGMRDKFCRVVKYHVDGPKLERWFLKTLINLIAGTAIRIGDATNGGIPTSELVEIAFGYRTFTPRAGLFAAIYVGQRVDPGENVQVAPLQRDGRVEGGLFSFRGHRFLLFLNSAGPPDRLSGIRLGDDDWSDCQLKLPQC
jgi:hypothetical protein